MRLLITGSSGMLGQAFIKLNQNKFEIITFDLPEFDITDYEKTIKYCLTQKPDRILHFAAFTKVDDAETNPDIAYKINVIGTRNMAIAASKLDIPLFYVSTDYIFNGTKKGLINENDLPDPLNIYGTTKLEGEYIVKQLLKKFYIGRTSWLFGINGKNFVDTMIKMGKEKKEFSVIDDQFGSPTYAVDLALKISEIIKTEFYGTYHITNSEYCSWYEFAKEILKLNDIDPNKIKPVKSEEFKRPATRPKNSRFNRKYLELGGFEPMPDWENALKRYLKEKYNI